MKEASSGGPDVIRALAQLVCKAGLSRLNYGLTVVVVCATALAMSIEAAQVRAANGSYR